MSVTGPNSRENLAVHRAIRAVDDVTVPMKIQQTVTLTIDIEIRKDPQLSGFIIALRKKVAAGMRDQK